MKTDDTRDRVARISRRAFVIGAGTAVAASTTGSAAETAEGDDGPGLTVEATAPYSSTVREVADAFQREAATERVTVNPTDGGPAERVRSGPADVLVSGDPVATGGDDDGENALRRGVTVQGWSALATRSDDWRESMRPPALRDAVTSDQPVEAWAESDWDSVSALESSGDERAEARTDEAAGLISPGGGRTALVRGTRAYQYALGKGGLGYYEVSPDDVGAPSAAQRRGDGAVPLVRLGYVYVDDDALERSATDSFLRFYRRQTPSVQSAGVDPDLGFDGDREAARV